MAFPKPTSLHVLRGNPSRRPILPEPEPAIAATMPDAPEFLVGYACDEWHRVGPELYRLGLLTIVDLHSFAAYCEAYKTWRTAVESVNDMAQRDSVTKGLMIKGKNGNPIQNPLVMTAKQAANDMVRYASEFGLTPVARRRLASDSFEERAPSKFSGLIAS